MCMSEDFSVDPSIFAMKQVPIQFTEDSGTIDTYNRQIINIFDPQPETLLIEDIANALSHICRFGGHCNEFYSVAQHCVDVSYRMKDAPKELVLAALLHDASEAYLGDIIKPLKYSSVFVDYKVLEHKFETVLAKKFGCTSLSDPLIKVADINALLDETQFLWDPPPYWAIPKIAAQNPEDRRPITEAWPCKKASQIFLDRYNELVGDMK